MQSETIENFWYESYVRQLRETNVLTLIQDWRFRHVACCGKTMAYKNGSDNEAALEKMYKLDIFYISYFLNQLNIL